MSMNLAFKIRSKNMTHIVDFPFQTPTNLTYKVLAANTTDERITLIADQLRAWSWSADEVKVLLDQIRTMLNDEDLTLIMI